jgi:thymidine kinase
MKRGGSLTIVCGSMYAGKSEELIRRARRALFAKRVVQVFKPKIDKRYDETMVVTHMGVKHKALPVRTSADLAKKIEVGTDMVCIEEVQFFDEGIVDLLINLADSGYEVVAAGLDQDFTRKPFGPMPRLLACADEVIKLRAICQHCGEPASHTYRAVDGQPAHKDDPVVLIGAVEAYEARCRKCHKLRGAPKKKFKPASG